MSLFNGEGWMLQARELAVHRTKVWTKKKGAERPPKHASQNAPASFVLSAAAARADELRIGFHTTLGLVDTFVLFFFADADSHSGLENAPYDQAGNKHPDEDGERTDQLTTEG